MKIRLYQKTDDDLFYFQFRTEGEQVILDSQSYQSKEGRNNGVKSVKKNAAIADHYEEHADGAKYYFVLKAGNHEEIGRSPLFDSKAEMATAMNTLFVKAGGKGKSPAGGDGKEYMGHKGNDNYRHLAMYESHTKDVKSGFGLFTTDDNHHYFAYNIGGAPMLLSESYKSVSGRDNGVESVTKNMAIADHYEKKQHSNGKYYFNLIAGNKQEIATSRWFDSEAEMSTAIINLISAPGGNAPLESKPKHEKMESNEKSNLNKASNPAHKKEQSVDDYLPCGDYAGQVWFHTFTKDGEHYFAFNSPDGKTYLRSEGYTSEKARDNGIESVKTNAPIEKRWTTGTALNDKYHYYALKAGNHQEIARSCYYGSKAEMEAAFAWVRGEQSILGEGAQFVDGKWWTAYMFRMKKEEEATRLKAETEVKHRAVETPVAKPVVAKSSEAKEDDYLACKEYKGHPVNDKINNVAFFKHASDNQFYFVLYYKNGDVRLRSEGFETAKERDQELAGVVKYANDQSMYSRWTSKNGEHFMDILKDKTGREVGRSCLKKVKEVTKTIGKTTVKGTSVSTAATMATGVTRTISQQKIDEKEDDYLDCKEYKGHTVTDKENNIAFFKHPSDNQYYFVMYHANGDVRLRSEGFETTAERDDELAAVIKYANKPSMYTDWNSLTGEYYLDILKDENGREVGRTCIKKGKRPVKAAPVVAAVAAAAVVEKVVEKKPPAPKEPKKPKDKEDDYLPCKEYKGHKVNDKINNVAFFKHASDNQFYFVLYNKDGEVRLRSEGFRTAEERDVELAGVVKYANDKSKYTKWTSKNGEYYMDILKDKTGREVGRSCLKKVKKDKPKAAPVVAAAAVAAVAAAPKPKKPVDKEDDYLPCKEYKGHRVNDKVNKVAFFKHKNGQTYFVVYDKSGDVRIRSEGFQNTKDRDSELAGVLKYINKKDMYKKKEQGEYFMDILYDKTGREVGRSCLKKKVKKAPPVVAPAVAAAAVVAAAPKPKPKKEPVKAAPVVKEVVKEKKKGGLGWLWALLGLLALLLLLWKGCGGCNKAAVVAPVVEEKVAPVVEEKVAPAVEEKVAPPVVEEKVAPPPVVEETVTPAIGVEAGFERVNEHK